MDQFSGGRSYLSSRTFNAADQVTGQNLGGSALGFSASYNNVQQPYQRSYTPSGGGGLTLQYQWGATVDASGNVTSNDNNGTVRKLVDASNSNRTMTYTYDDMKRIASGVEADNNISATMTIDRYGNRTNQSGTLNESFTVDANTNRINASGFTYDAAGRMTAGNWGGVSRTMTWDPDGNLLSYSDTNTSNIAYLYDPFGRRVQAGSTRYLYGMNSGGHPLAEYTSSWQTNVEADGQVIATVDSASPPNVTYVAMDALGTTKMTVTSGGTASSVATYYPYGEEGVSISSEFKLTSQIRESYGVDHFWHRKFAGPLARWLTPDPINTASRRCGRPDCGCTGGEAKSSPLQIAVSAERCGGHPLPNGCGGQSVAPRVFSAGTLHGLPQSLDRYSYVLNGPTNWLDRGGEDISSFEACFWTCMGICEALTEGFGTWICIIGCYSACEEITVNANWHRPGWVGPARNRPWP